MAHGKKSRALVDGYTMTNVGRGLRHALNKQNADSTVIEDDDHTCEAGQKGGTFSIDYVFKNEPNLTAAIDNTIGDDDSPHAVMYGPGGFDVGNLVLMGNCLTPGARSTGDNKSVVSGRLDYEATGGWAVGYLLTSPYA